MARALIRVLVTLVCLCAMPYRAASAAQDRVEQERTRSLSSNPSLAVIGRAADFTLPDLNGQPVKLSDFRGQVVLMAFIFTTCKSVCPLISQQMGALQNQLKQRALFGTKASLLSVTVDPDNDTQEVLGSYARSFHADSAGWKFLRDSPERMRPMFAAYDEWTKRLPEGDLDHPARIYLIDRSGAMREVYSLSFFDERQAMLDIEALLRE